MLFFSACDGGRTNSRRVVADYTFTTGHVTDGGYNPGVVEYFVTMAKRPGEPPWLLIAERFDPATSGFTIERSSDSTAVTVDSTTYTPVADKCIVVLQYDGRPAQRILVPSEHSTLQRLVAKFSTVSGSELTTLLPSAPNPDQTQATEPAAGQEPNGKPSPSVR